MEPKRAFRLVPKPLRSSQKFTVFKVIMNNSFIKAILYITDIAVINDHHRLAIIRTDIKYRITLVKVMLNIVFGRHRY